MDALTVRSTIVSFRMQHVHLANNYITMVTPGTFDYLPALSLLDLSNNNLRVLKQNMFTMNQLLQRIYLYDNELVRIEESFDRVTGLEILDVSSNQLVDFGRVPYAGLLATGTKMRILNIANNRFECKCDLQWLLNATVNSQVNVVENIRKSGDANAVTCPVSEDSNGIGVTIDTLIKNTPSVEDKLRQNDCR